jgi:hypothetical protein
VVPWWFVSRVQWSGATLGGTTSSCKACDRAAIKFVKHGDGSVRSLVRLETLICRHITPLKLFLFVGAYLVLVA